MHSLAWHKQVHCIQNWCTHWSGNGVHQTQQLAGKGGLSISVHSGIKKQGMAVQKWVHSIDTSSELAKVERFHRGAIDKDEADEEELSCSWIISCEGVLLPSRTVSYPSLQNAELDILVRYIRLWDFFLSALCLMCKCKKQNTVRQSVCPGT